MASLMFAGFFSIFRYVSRHTENVLVGNSTLGIKWRIKCSRIFAPTKTHKYSTHKTLNDIARMHITKAYSICKDERGVVWNALKYVWVWNGNSFFDVIFSESFFPAAIFRMLSTGVFASIYLCASNEHKHT